MPETSSDFLIKQRYSVAECLVILGVSKAHFYKRVREGAWGTFKDGRRTFMTAEQLRAAGRPNDKDNLT